MIPFLKRVQIEARHQEEMDGIVDQLTIHVQILPKESNLHAILNAAEQDLGEIGSQIRAAKDLFVLLQDGWCGMAVELQ